MFNPKKIQFNKADKVHSVSAVGKLRQYDCIPLLKFWDKDGNIINSYDPLNLNYETEEIKHELKENEELIGVYGLMYTDRSYYKSRCLKSFGFIIKVKQP